MITEHLFSFAVVVIIQLIFFTVHAFSVGKERMLPEYLLKGLLLGIPFGIIFDLIVGKYFGLFEYELGFSLWFLTLNGAFSYGFMLANVFLLHRHSLHHMYFWSAGLGLTYEVVNFFFPVWEWTFATPWVEYAAAVFFLYAALSWLMMVVLQLVYKVKFRLVPLK